ncbi:F0F1 ATP synthase subunit epsilon [Bacillus sp. RG28]|uniref:ATP synthase epsilon chain n=1 Tax=Gottfriedia endophytica TaxID=2820819 RepID=A0A940NP10_9BACI|nr:F0F1 ATP synthase subunit epsilon [Gottfriedia endophytica]MBP0725070.1 F0F1 ATP synthase subunit epsilon [Gottfriedia endophytica]
MKTMKVSIVTPNGPAYEGETDFVSTKATSGELGILPGHISTVAPLATAPVKVKTQAGTDYVAVSGGFIEIRPEAVTILAQSAELSNEIDIERAVEAKKRAEQRIQEHRPEIDIKRAEYALRRAINRLEVAKHR